MGDADENGAVQGRFKNNYFDGLPVTEAQKLLFFMLMLFYFFQQFCNWNFCFLAPSFARGLAPDTPGAYRIVCIVAVFFFLGQGLGAFVTGILSDRWGRRRILMISLLIFSVGSFVNGLVTGFPAFVLARSVTGYGIFSVMVITNAYIAELTPAESRGKWQSVVATVGFTAVPLVAILSHLTVPIAPEAWRYIFLFGGVGVITFFLALLFIKESPRWLVGKGRIAEAEEVMRDLTGKDVDLSHLARPVENMAPAKALKILCGPGYRVRFFLQLALMGICTPAIFMVLTWPGILLEDPLGIEPALRIFSIMCLAVPVGCLMSAYLSDSLGRKSALLLILSVCGLSVLGYGFCPPNSPLLIVLGMGHYTTVLGATFVLFTFSAESFPTALRNTAVGFVQGFGRFTMVAVQPLFYWVALTYGRSGFCTLIGLLLLLPLPLLIFVEEETSGRSLEELNAVG